MPEAQTPFTPTIIRNVYPMRSGRSHTPTNESPRRRRRSHVPMKPVNDAKLSKRRKVIEEFYDTERTYVEGLELIYSHFLTPIIAALETSEPLLDRSSLTSVFSNFIDIWNLHRSFFSSLTILLTTSVIPSPATDNNYSDPPASLSPLLLSHFPYLSLYNPFVTAFPTAISSLTDLITSPSSTRPNPKYSATFTTYLATQESDPRCGKLKLRDWLLTIVQRCPRYLLLLKDLIACTDEEDPEYTNLTQVQALVSKITLSLNTSLHTHTQTLALLSLQRATPNLPFQLIVPGRTLLKRGSLLQIERSVQPREREFLLFSDCLIWLAGEEVERAQWKGDWGISRSGWGADYTESGPAKAQRSRDKGEEEASVKVQDSRLDTDPREAPPSTTRPTGRNALKKSHHPPLNMIGRRNASSGGDERWIYKGRVELVDLEVVVMPAREEGEECRFEILSPEGSFVLYSGTRKDRDEWCSEIRQAKAQLLSSLNVTHPNSTLTSSSSTNHLRRSLQALPFPPTDERIATYRTDESNGQRAKAKGKEDAQSLERRRAESVSAGEGEGTTVGCVEGVFVLRVLDGFVKHFSSVHNNLFIIPLVQTFFISDSHTQDNSSKPARACDTCYETVFPLIDPVPDATPEKTGAIHQQDTDRFPSLSSLPSWLSVPSFPGTSTPRSLMAIEREPSPSISYVQDFSAYDQSGNHRRIKPRLQSTRVRSYNQLLENFEQNDHGRSDVMDSRLEEENDSKQNGCSDTDDDDLDCQSSSRVSINGQASSPRKEDTVRRHDRFSSPAVALHATNVTARTSAVFDDDDLTEDGASSPIKTNKRFSLVLGGRHRENSGMRGQSEVTVQSGDSRSGAAGTKSELVKSIAAGKLSEILARKKE
ncbi:hypothetical protein C0989_009619 [Termitomyces sp. Mn162]|nr:hypothetical protein C0989_009619 [Termitomyces sp. Mn162]